MIRMGIRTTLLDLVGDRQAILDLAANRWAVVVGFLTLERRRVAQSESLRRRRR
jgi:hypothetical protein